MEPNIHPEVSRRRPTQPPLPPPKPPSLPQPASAFHSLGNPGTQGGLKNEFTGAAAAILAWTAVAVAVAVMAFALLLCPCARG